MELADKRVWYSSGDKIVSMSPCEGYEEVVFSSVTDWFNFIQSLVQDGYKIT
jgi:hypothetical protein